MNRQTLAEDLTLMLLYLNSWEETAGAHSFRRAWKGYDFDDLNLLEDLGYISGRRSAKSVYLKDEGLRAAEELFEDYGIALDPIPTEQPFFRLALSFRFEELNCSRTLLVPKHTSFFDFHIMIQTCLNWLNYHLFDFTLSSGGKEIFISLPDEESGGDPRLENAPRGEKLSAWRDAETSYLDDFLPKTKKMLYSYDYGDGWEIEIKLVNSGEKIASDVPICWEGAGDAPPEDVGGEGGFIEFLETISDPENDDYDQMLAWGEVQGFEHFSQSLTNRRLRHWFEWEAVDNVNALDEDEGMEAQDGMREAEAMMLLLNFEASLRNSGLSEKTVQQHMDNVAYFIIVFLLEVERASVMDSIDYLDDFMGDFLPNECAWVTASSLKATSTSLKKFYKHLYDTDVISKEQLQEAQDILRTGLPVWLKAFNEQEMPDNPPFSGFKLV